MNINPFPFLFSALGKFIYARMGWTYDPLPAYWEPRCVVIGFPHTTNMDTVRALTYTKIAGINAKLLIKSKWFFFPMSIFLKSLGGIPVKRDKSYGFVDGVIKKYEKNENLVVAMVPEVPKALPLTSPRFAAAPRVTACPPSAARAGSWRARKPATGG